MRVLRHLVPAVASLALIASCGSSSDGKAADAATVTTKAAGTKTTPMDHSGGDDHGTAAHDTSGHGTTIAGSADGTSPCEKSSPKPASPGQANESGASDTNAEGGHGGRGMLKQLPVTNEQRKTLIVEMAQARSVVAKFPTVKDAEAAGYGLSTDFVPCIGAHYSNLNLVVKFDPSAPSELLFDGTSPGSKIVGLSYLVYSNPGPPEGFAGPNDHFHQHNANGGLCLNPSQKVIGGENMSVKDCEAKGGKKSSKLMEHIWMAHAWVAPGWECSWGVFAGECPELGGRLGGTAFDAPKKQ